MSPSQSLRPQGAVRGQRSSQNLLADTFVSQQCPPANDSTSLLNPEFDKMRRSKHLDLLVTNRFNATYITPQETVLLQDKAPVLVVDVNESLKAKIGHVSLGRMIKSKVLHRQTGLDQQQEAVAELLGLLETFCGSKPTLYNTAGSFQLDPDPASEATRSLYGKTSSDTSWAFAVNNVQSEMSKDGSENGKTPDTRDVVVCVLAKADAREALTALPWLLPARDSGRSELKTNQQIKPEAVKNEWGKLAENGIVVTTPDGEHMRKVFVSILYLGDETAIEIEKNHSRIASKDVWLKKICRAVSSGLEGKDDRNVVRQVPAKKAVAGENQVD